MGAFVVKHLIEKPSGRFAYRRRVPSDLQDTIKKTEWNHAYPKGTTKAQAYAATIKYDEKYDAEIVIAKMRSGDFSKYGNASDLKTYEAALNYVAERGWIGDKDLSVPRDDGLHEPITMAEVWCDEHTTQNHHKGPTGYYSTYTWDSPFSMAVCEVLAQRSYPEDRDLLLSAAFELDTEQNEDGEDKALKYAVESFIALVGDLDLRKINNRDTDKWKRLCLRSGLKVGTVKRRSGALRALIARQFRTFQITAPNPFEGLSFKGAHSDEDRLPFSTEHFDMIDAHLASSKRMDQELKTMMLILKYTGARQSEIFGLVADDLKLDGEVPHILIRKNAVRDLKTLSSKRSIPLNAVCAKELAKLKGEKSGSEPIFREKNRDTNNVSAKINKAIRAAGVPKSPKLVGYSFRHAMKEALVAADVPDSIQRYLMGHSDTSISSHYGSPARDLGKLKKHLDNAIRFLGDVPEGTYDSL